MLDFDFNALDALVTTRMMGATMLKVEVEHEASRVEGGDGDPATQAGSIERVSSPVIKEKRDG